MMPFLRFILRTRARVIRPSIWLAAFIVALVPLLVSAVSCGPVQSAGVRQPVTIRMSTGFPSGNFRPFSEALVKGYAQLMPEVRIELFETRGSLGNIQGLEDGTVDIGLSQAGIAYMAYNGRLRESGPRRAGCPGGTGRANRTRVASQNAVMRRPTS